MEWPFLYKRPLKLAPRQFLLGVYKLRICGLYGTRAQDLSCDLRKHFLLIFEHAS